MTEETLVEPESNAKALKEFWEIMKLLWKGNAMVARGFVRIALLMLLAWPFVAMGIAAINHDLAFVAIPIWSFVLAGALVVLAYYFPLIISAAGIAKITRPILWNIFTIIAFELIVGIYFTFVPVANDRVLILPLSMVMITMLFLHLSVKASWIKMAKSAGWLIMIAITVIFFYGGVEKIEEKALARQYHPPANPAPYPQDYNKKETRRFEYPEPGGGVAVKLTTNCDKEDFIAVIPPRHKIELHHVYFAETVKANRCSYNVYGDSFPVFGPSGSFRTKRELQNDLPAPQFKAHMSLIKLAYPDKTVYQAIESNGDKIEAKNCSDGEIRVYSVYNITKAILFSGAAQQIGHDGSTITLEGVIRPTTCS